jgi:GNAT superfamily N-acetyltransferase
MPRSPVSLTLVACSGVTEYELNDDVARIDVEAVHAFLSTEAYWALGRALEDQRRLVREATRVVGLYHDGRQVGFCRAVSDGLTFAYLCDVYVLPAHRGSGQGQALVRFMVDTGPLADLRWFLSTADAHTLYEKLGFSESERLMVRLPRPLRR